MKQKVVFLSSLRSKRFLKVSRTFEAFFAFWLRKNWGERKKVKESSLQNRHRQMIWTKEVDPKDVINSNTEVRLRKQATKLTLATSPSARNVRRRPVKQPSRATLGHLFGPYPLTMAIFCSDLENSRRLLSTLEPSDCNDFWHRPLKIIHLSFAWGWMASEAWKWEEKLDTIREAVGQSGGRWNC